MIWSIISATMNVSSSMIPLLMVTLSRSFDWRISFIIIGTVSCFFSFISYHLITDQPSDLTGDNPTTPFANTQDTSQLTEKDSSGSNSKSSNYLLIFSSRFLFLISLSYLLWTGVKNAVEDWLLVYLIDVKSLTPYQGM